MVKPNISIYQRADNQELGFTRFVKFQAESYPQIPVECLVFFIGSVQPNLRAIDGYYLTISIFRVAEKSPAVSV